MKPQKHRIGPLVFVAALAATSFAAWHQRLAIYDWARLRGYTPSATIAQLATNTTMNDSARRLFYVYHPELNGRDDFNHNCTNIGEETIVLGCYASTRGIYLFDVDDPRLEGVEEVTAAHEMLHAAYERLSTEERSKVDILTQQTLASLKNERIKTTVESYRSRDPSIVPNELHSIIGTEVRNLPTELETYYQKYFTNRAQIVALSERYEGVLTERRNRAGTLEKQINTLKSQIEQLEKTLTDERERLHADRAGANTVEEVTAYNKRVSTFNAEIRELNNLITKHNALVEEYKANAVEQQELFKALDSRPAL